jgi:hypothetical protein
MNWVSVWLARRTSTFVSCILTRKMHLTSFLCLDGVMLVMYDIYEQFKAYIITLEGMGMKTVYYIRTKLNFGSLILGSILDINSLIFVIFKNPFRE